MKTNKFYIYKYKMNLTNLSKDTIILTALNLDFPSILKLCKTSSIFNKNICKNNDFWIKMLLRDFNLEYEYLSRNYILTPKDYYLSIIYYNKLSPNDALKEVSKKGDISLIDFYIKMGAYDWNAGLEGAAKGGYIDLVDFYIQKGANFFDRGLDEAIKNGHRDIVNFLLSKGASSMSALFNSAKYGHKDLVELFIARGYADLNSALHGAVVGGHKDLVEFIISKGANDWNGSLELAIERGRRDLSSKEPISDRYLVDLFISKYPKFSWVSDIFVEIAEKYNQPELADYLRTF